jgi:cytochrome P450
MGLVETPATEVDLFDPAVLHDPHLLYARLRADHRPALAHDGSRILSRYDEVRTALHDHGTFSSAETNGATRRTLPVLVGTDPPEHTRLRRLVTGQFSAQGRRQWEPRVEDRIEALVDSVVRPGRLEAVSALCSAVPIAVLSILLGIDERALTGLLAEDPARHRTGRRAQFARFFRDEVATRRRDGGGSDLLTGLIVDGDALSEEELVAFCILLLAAGVDSMRDLLANLLVELAAVPTLWEEMRAVLDLDDLAQECVRYVSPVQGVFRTAARPVLLASGPLHQGDRVLLLIGSANRDDAVWADAGRLCADRYGAVPSPVAHLGWGSGVHACLGGLMARLQTRTVLRALLAKEVHLSMDTPVLRGRIPYFRTVKRLDLTVST